MKTIFEIEDIRRLRACVTRELVGIGISIPKSYKSSSSLSRKSKRLQTKVKEKNQSQSGTAVFGVPLCDIPSDFIEGCGYVPRFLVDAVNYIEANIETIGLFRKTGSVHRQKELRHVIENGGSVKCAKIVDDVANLIKQFLRELPESLITSTLESHFMKALQIDDADTQLKATMLLCLLLPLDHIGTLRFITLMLSKIVENSAMNKMDCNNLALVMTPNVMYRRGNDSRAMLCDEKQLSAQTALVEYLIHNANLIGVVSAELDELMSLETSADGSNIDDEDCSIGGKQKKKRRSGSLQGMMSSIEQNLKSWRNKKSSSFVNSSTTSDHSLGDLTSDANITSVSVESSTSSNASGHKTPIVRKRKAEDDPVGLSKKKMKTIVKGLPQQCILTTAPFDMTSMPFKANATFPVSKSMSAAMDTTKETDPATLPASASFTSESNTKKRFPSPFRKKVRRTPSGESNKCAKRIFRLLSVNHDSNKAKQTRETVTTLRNHKKTISSPVRILDGERLMSPRSECYTPTTGIKDENVYIIDDNSESSSSAEHLQQDLYDGIVSPPSPDVSLNSEMMTSHKPWGPARRDGAETPTKINLRRGRPNTPTNGLHPALKKKYCHDEDDVMMPLDAEAMNELNAHVAVIVCNATKSNGLAKNLFGDTVDAQTYVSGSNLMTPL